MTAIRHICGLAACGLFAALAFSASGASTPAKGTEKPAAKPTADAKPAPTPPVAQPAVSGEALEARIKELIAQLGSTKHTEREAAQKELVEIGAPAVMALGRAGAGKDAEQALRARVALGRILGGPQPTVKIFVRRPVMVDMPVWVYVKTDDKLLAANLRYPFKIVPWMMGQYGFEVRQKGKLLPPRPINPNIGLGGGLGSVAPPSSPTGRLPLHLLYRFAKPGKYEVRLLVYFTKGQTGGSRAVIAASDWLELNVQPLRPGHRQEWLKKMKAVPPKDFGQIVGDYLPSLLARPDDAVAAILENMLYHESELVQGYALYALWGYYDDQRIRKDIPQLIKKRGPTVLLAYFLSWRRDLFAEKGVELAEVCMAALQSQSPTTVTGGMQALIFLKSHFDWTKHPGLPAKMDKAVFAAADKVAKVPDATARVALCCYLGTVKTDASQKLLWKLTEDPLAREQAMICLCWIGSQQDLPKLARVLMTGGKGASSLPYHLFRAYGKESLPYIERAGRESPDPRVRQQCQRFIQRMAKPSPPPKGSTPAASEKDHFLPYAAGIPGEVRVFYWWHPAVPWSKPMKVRRIERDVRYRAMFFDPRTGAEHRLGVVKPDARGAWAVPIQPEMSDWAMVMEARSSRRA